jgi:hypothetical protein
LTRPIDMVTRVCAVKCCGNIFRVKTDSKKWSCSELCEEKLNKYVRRPPKPGVSFRKDVDREAKGRLVKRMKELWLTDLMLLEIVEKLNEEGYTTSTGKKLTSRNILNYVDGLPRRRERRMKKDG